MSWLLALAAAALVEAFAPAWLRLLACLALLGWLWLSLLVSSRR